MCSGKCLVVSAEAVIIAGTDANSGGGGGGGERFMPKFVNHATHFSTGVTFWSILSNKFVFYDV